VFISVAFRSSERWGPGLVVPAAAATRSRGAMGLLSWCVGSPATVAPVAEAGQSSPPPRAGHQVPLPIVTGTAENAATLYGLLTSAQQIELHSAFRQFDINNNGTIDQRELKQVMQQLGSPLSDGAMATVLNSLDLDSNGQIEWSEFASLMADRWLRQDGDTDMQLALGLLSSGDVDGDDDGDISVERMRELLCSCGEAPLAAAEWEDFKKLADPNATGRVSAKAFKSLPCWQPPPPPPPSASRRGGSRGAGRGGPD